MLDLQLLRTDLDGVARRLATRGFVLDVASFAALEHERKDIQMRTQELQAKRSAVSKQIGIAKGKGEDAAALMAEVGGIGEALKGLEAQLEALQQQLRKQLLAMPNLPHESTPPGKS